MNAIEKRKRLIIWDCCFLWNHSQLAKHHWKKLHSLSDWLSVNKSQKALVLTPCASRRSGGYCRTPFCPCPPFPRVMPLPSAPGSTRPRSAPSPVRNPSPCLSAQLSQIYNTCTMYKMHSYGLSYKGCA